MDLTSLRLAIFFQCVCLVIDSLLSLANLEGDQEHQATAEDDGQTRPRPQKKVCTNNKNGNEILRDRPQSAAVNSTEELKSSRWFHHSAYRITC